MKTLFEKMRANRAKSQAVIAKKRQQHSGGIADRSDIERQRQMSFLRGRSRALQDNGAGPLSAWRCL